LEARGLRAPMLRLFETLLDVELTLPEQAGQRPRHEVEEGGEETDQVHRLPDHVGDAQRTGGMLPFGREDQEKMDHAASFRPRILEASSPATGRARAGG